MDEPSILDLVKARLAFWRPDPPGTPATRHVPGITRPTDGGGCELTETHGAPAGPRDHQPEPGRSTVKRSHVLVPLALVLVVAAGLRLVGLDWDEQQHLHPDERFLTMVTASLRPVGNLGAYFDTARSTLNPKNTGAHPDYVYGTFPIILTYLLGELTGHSGYGEVHMVGRVLSALCDVLVVLLVFVLGRRVGGDRVGLLAATLSALTVLQIQQSHFFTVDNFANLFVVLALLAATRIATSAPPETRRWRPRAILLADTALFATAAAAALAAKLNTAPVVLLLPLAFAAWSRAAPPARRHRAAGHALLWLGGASLLCFACFRLLHPYVFSGPGVLGLRPNPHWVSTISNLIHLSGPDANWPPAMQWARRSFLFPGKNMVLWGMGPAFGVLAWVGFVWAGWRLLHGSWRRGLVCWLWIACYFGWQSASSNPTMRYLLPVYPALAVMAGWALVELAERGRRRLAVVTAAVVLATTAAWAVAFAGIYTRPVTRVAASRWIYDTVPAAITVTIESAAGASRQLLPFPDDVAVSPERPYEVRFPAAATGRVVAVELPHVITVDGAEQERRLHLGVQLKPGPWSVAEAVLPAAAEPDPHGSRHQLLLEPPVAVRADEPVNLRVEVSRGAVRLAGAALANESSWDDGLPLRLDGRDPYGKLYQGDLNFEMYWDDDASKLDRLVEVLDRADHVLISSSRQWASLSRLPERYPLTTAYYRDLLGCPPDRSVEACYNRAQPGQTLGRLGFDLIRLFESHPSLGPLRINDQGAEEAFTVYDHPLVLVFEKSKRFSADAVRQRLGKVDLDRVVQLAPGRAAHHRADLMLPDGRLDDQRSGGTWSELFDRTSPVNRWPWLTVLLWYLTVTGLGVVTYPVLRLALPGLPDGGWAASRLGGLLMLGYSVWLLGSLGVEVSRSMISGVIACIALAGAALGWRQRSQLRELWRQHRRSLLTAEALFAALFLLGLLVRWANPDLWHASRGGEKPMDFSYFNAVLKSSTFPPYDPWFAGGYINYYYWGFVLVGMPVKWLGIVPAVAYNLILPTLLAIIGCGAYTVASGLARAGQRRTLAPETVGLAAAAGMAVLGNLGTLRMIVQGLQHLGGAGAAAGLWARVEGLVRGLMRLLSGARLPYSVGDWYWSPSRIISDPEVSPITEFPCFTFLFADLHAHFIDLGVTLLVLAWVVSMALGWRRWAAGGLGPARLAVTIAFGGVAVGSLRAINTWSFYPYLALAAIAVAYARWRSLDRPVRIRAAAAVVAAAALVAVAHASFAPYARWYGQGYSAVDPWRGATTTLEAFLTHWGLFLFVIVTWLAWESRECMATTPVSALHRLAPYRASLLAAGMAALAAMAWLVHRGVSVAWIVWPVAVAAGIHVLRPRLDDARRTVLVLVGTALMLVLMVELVVLRGDLGRMNTVFKFYLQAWTLLAVSAAVALGWLLPSVPSWRRTTRSAWCVTLVALVVAAALFPILAGSARVADRMSRTAPRTLDGMAYMATASYHDQGRPLDLGEDYLAIRWLQDNVSGSPVIVEANTPEYRWGSRMTVYTGLPGVVGWSWHQRQQRSLAPDRWVWERLNAVNRFYDTPDPEVAAEFLATYDVRYIVVGQLERAYHPGPGLAKFPAHDGDLWRAIFTTGETTIYEVQPESKVAGRSVNRR